MEHRKQQGTSMETFSQKAGTKKARKRAENEEARKKNTGKNKGLGVSSYRGHYSRHTCVPRMFSMQIMLTLAYHCHIQGSPCPPKKNLAPLLAKGGTREALWRRARGDKIALATHRLGDPVTQNDFQQGLVQITECDPVGIHPSHTQTHTYHYPWRARSARYSGKNLHCTRITRPIHVIHA